MKILRILGISGSWTILLFSGAEFWGKNCRNPYKHWDYRYFFRKQKMRFFLGNSHIYSIQSTHQTTVRL